MGEKKQNGRNAIEVCHLTKDYGGGKGVFDLSFCVKRGEILGFLGQNGAGKTTTIRHLLGFLTPEKGNVSILGMDCRRQAETIQKSLGYIPGEISFLDDMSGIQFLRFLAKYRGMRDFSRAEELIRRFELDPSGKIRKMSKGMKQKIAMVAAFMDCPSVLILDEPTSGLDPLMQKRFTELLLEEKERGAAILMSSHIFEEIEKVCDRVAVIRQGKLVAVQEMEEVKRQRKKCFLVTFENEAEAARFVSEQLESGAEIRKLEKEKVKIELREPNELNTFLHVLGGYRLSDLESASESLEEYFMQFYGGDEDDQ